MNRRSVLVATAVALLFPNILHADNGRDWQGILDGARGQTVYWHAWGGDPKINDFIDWVGQEADARYGVTLEHVKLSSTSDAVARVVAEREAGIDAGGAVDMIWINGENFAAMKDQGLLYGPFVDALPNWKLVDVKGKPAVVTDFTLPTDGFESPWAMAQFIFEYDSARLATPPRSLQELKAWIKDNPGRFTYPQLPDYLGNTFLKQVAYGTLKDPSVMQKPLIEAEYDAVTMPLWAFLDEITPYLWRQGRAYPRNESALAQLLADGEVDIGFAFNPGRASVEVAAGNLPETMRTFIFEEGTIGNASFVAIPYNAAHKEGAMVIASLILDPMVQARAQDPDVLGFQTVLNVADLAQAENARFGALKLGVATLPPEKLTPSLLEPHPTWAVRFNEDWAKRYGVSQ